MKKKIYPRLSLHFSIGEKHDYIEIKKMNGYNKLGHMYNSAVLAKKPL